MHQISFQSGVPAEHVCRAVVVARKNGFEFARLSVEPTVLNELVILVTFGKGAPSAI